MGRMGIHHSTRMGSSGSLCFLVVLVPVLGVPLPTPDPLNVHIHLDDAMKNKESAVKHEEHGKDYGDGENDYPVYGPGNIENPMYAETDRGAPGEMNIGSIGNVMGNVNDGTSGSSMDVMGGGSGSAHMFSGPGGNTMFSGGGRGNHFSMQSGGGNSISGRRSGSGFGSRFGPGFGREFDEESRFFRSMSSGFGGGSFGGGNTNNLFSSGGSSSGGNNNNLFSSGGGMMGDLNSLTGGFASGGGNQIVGGAQRASGTNVNQNNIG